MPKRIKYVQHGGGYLESFKIKQGMVKKIVCCDCNLAHVFIFEPGRKGEIDMAVYRDDYTTDELRRKAKRAKK
jgi:hypothetical protein